MKLADLKFEYPEDLIAVSPQRPSRVLLCQPEREHEISVLDLLDLFNPGDVLVVNDTKVEPRRVFAKSESGDELEILFVEKLNSIQWQVLFPSSKLKPNEKILLPGQVSARLIQKGRPQVIELSREYTREDFSKFGEMPLPPYIQKARASRHESDNDRKNYQAVWAQKEGSSAAPTASLHFSLQDLEVLRHKGVRIETITLHVGLGTYLPVSVENLSEHKMHSEKVILPKSTLKEIENAKSRGKKIWALGTTVARALESWPRSYFNPNENRDLEGSTDLLIQENFDFKVVDVLMTNFHQPESTLLALVMGFGGRKRVLDAYKFAIEKRFRLFSYGDLSVWMKD